MPDKFQASKTFKKHYKHKMRRAGFSIVMLVAFFIADLIFYRAFKDVIRHLQSGVQRWLSILYWTVPALLLLLFVYGFFISPETATPRFKKFLGVSFMLIYTGKLVGAIVFLFGNGLNIIKNASLKAIQPSKTAPILSRSEFISKTALAFGAAQFGILTQGMLWGAYDYRVRKVTLHLKGLPKAFDGMTLGQLSDIHSGSFYNKKAVQGGVKLLLDEKPDLIFFTGDLVNDKATELQEYFSVFEKVKAPLGVYSTLGNHDYGDYAAWSSPQAKVQNLQNLIKGHELLGWDLLMDENRILELNGEKLGILGVQNWGTGGFVQKGDLQKALKGTEEINTKLLLSHDPTHWRAQVLGKTDIDAVFSGHTHGMQFGVEIPGFRWSPSQYVYKEWAGLYEENGQQLYVNRGFGFLGYPGRVGILPEITIFNLKSV